MERGKEAESLLPTMRARMVKTVSVVVIVFGLISALVISRYGTPNFGESYFLGALLGIVNGAIGFLTIERFIDKSTLVFLKGVFLGMGIRLLLLLGVFIFLVEVVHLHIAGLVSGLLIYYFTMTVLEVIFLNRRIEITKTIRESKP